ncbi:hypothetical protein TNIN_409211 [Trichonephila inaurata madagascariensis]|uniref:Uncharacterized protein n=1 Tax=Trichonephila inaurata madagascariensis TaxID=2747483 RepID=A0A8X6YFV5_9ARAC|nr:hypothetical protein TNIN_409211 [Trichonephila inaurata madagascariensis]
MTGNLSRSFAVVDRNPTDTKNRNVEKRMRVKFVKATCQSTTIEKQEVHHAILRRCLSEQSDQSSIFENVRDLISTPGLPPDDNMSQVATQTISHLITEENLPLFNLCSRKLFSASAEKSFFVVHS